VSQSASDDRAMPKSVELMESESAKNGPTCHSEKASRRVASTTSYEPNRPWRLQRCFKALWHKPPTTRSRVVLLSRRRQSRCPHWDPAV